MKWLGVTDTRGGSPYGHGYQQRRPEQQRRGERNNGLDASGSADAEWTARRESTRRFRSEWDISFRQPAAYKLYAFECVPDGRVVDSELVKQISKLGADISPVEEETKAVDVVSFSSPTSYQRLISLD